METGESVVGTAIRTGGDGINVDWEDGGVVAVDGREGAMEMAAGTVGIISWWWWTEGGWGGKPGGGGGT